MISCGSFKPSNSISYLRLIWFQSVKPYLWKLENVKNVQTKHWIVISAFTSQQMGTDWFMTRLILITNADEKYFRHTNRVQHIRCCRAPTSYNTFVKIVTDILHQRHCHRLKSKTTLGGDTSVGNKAILNISMFLSILNILCLF